MILQCETDHGSLRIHYHCTCIFDSFPVAWRRLLKIERLLYTRTTPLFYLVCTWTWIEYPVATSNHHLIHLKGRWYLFVVSREQLTFYSPLLKFYSRQCPPYGFCIETLQIDHFNRPCWVWLLAKHTTF